MTIQRLPSLHQEYAFFYHFFNKNEGLPFKYHSSFVPQPAASVNTKLHFPIESSFLKIFDRKMALKSVHVSDVPSLSDNAEFSLCSPRFTNKCNHIFLFLSFMSLLFLDFCMVLFCLVGSFWWMIFFLFGFFCFPGVNNHEGDRDCTFKFPKFVVMGHRGSGMNMLQSSDKRMKSIKENSILSFNAAAKLPLDFIEFDVQVRMRFLVLDLTG